MWIQSLGQEDPLERKWQPTPVFLPGKWEEPCRLQSMGSQRVGDDLAPSLKGPGTTSDDIGQISLLLGLYCTVSHFSCV